MRRLLALWAGLMLFAFAAAATWLAAGRDAAPPAEATLPTVQPPSAPMPPEHDAQQPDATADAHPILGTWQDHYRGRRTMTLLDDGTGTMVCELEGLDARLFTPVLNFNLRWQLEGGVMTRVIVDGEPADKVQFVINLMGARADEKMLALTDTELRLLDSDGKTEYHWTRVPCRSETPDTATRRATRDPETK